MDSFDQQRFEFVSKVTALIDDHEWSEEDIREAVEDGIGDSRLAAPIDGPSHKPKPKPKKSKP